MTDITIPDNLHFGGSYVLNIEVKPYAFRLDMDFALTPRHPEYKAPSSMEQECYRRGTLVIDGFKKFLWAASGIRPSRDANNENDYGNLDSFVFSEGNWKISGDWGVVEIEKGELSIVLFPL